MAVVTMRQLLESGVHFGHQTRRWNPKMKRFIFTERNGIYIVDLQQSLSYIDRAYEFVKETVAHGGSILFVGTKKQAQEPVAEQAARVGGASELQRWIGGMRTTFRTVHMLVERLKELEEIDFDDVAGSALTKKELLVLRREKDKLARTLGGIRDMAKVPSAVWIVDTNKEHLAVDEARKLHIPIVAILDTNCDPDVVDYKIPGNDDAIRSVTLLTRVIADAVAEGLLQRHSGRSGAEAEAGASAEPLAEWERELLAGAEQQLEADEKAAEANVEAAAAEGVAEAAAEVAAEEPGDATAEVVEEAAAAAAVVAAAQALVAAAQAAGAVERRRVDRRAQRALAREDADERAVARHGRDLETRGVELLVGRLEPGPTAVEHGGVEDEGVVGHHLVDLGEAVDVGAVGLRDHADRAPAVHDDRGAVRALADEREGGVDGVVRADDDGRLDDGVLGLHVRDDVRHDVGRDVLRDDRDAAAPRHGLRHAAPRDGRHVGDDDGDRRARAVGGGEVDVEARRDLGARRDEEHVAVGEVGRGGLSGQEAHGSILRGRTPPLSAVRKENSTNVASLRPPRECASMT